MNTAVIYHGKRFDRIEGVTEVILSVDGVAVRSGEEVSYKSSAWDKIEITPARHEPYQQQLPFKD